MIKMIVADLDDTLLRSDKSVSAYSAEVFNRCRELGIKVVFATARPIRAVDMLDTGIDYDAATYHNGAVISVGGQVVHNIGIPPEDAKKLLLQAAALAEASAEINDTNYANFDAESLWPYSNHTLTDFTDIPPEPADKLIFITTDSAKIAELESMFDDNLYWEISENQIVMVMNKNARKLNAVKVLAERFGVDMAEIAAFGDDYNDIELLRACGMGVAVENAIEEAKSAADFICAGNDSDGVARWLEAHILTTEAQNANNGN